MNRQGKPKESSTPRTTALYYANDYWWWRNPADGHLYGPFTKREAARDHARKIKTGEITREVPKQRTAAG